MTMPVSVLCARRDSVYKGFPGVEVYDADRNAWTYPGGMPVVAHPPCRTWGGLKHFAKPADMDKERELARWCVRQVRGNGGVLEHPQRSGLWVDQELPVPRTGRDAAGGWSLQVPQWWWGHKGHKQTWLYIVGVDPAGVPTIPLRLVDQSIRPVEKLSRRQRESTPVDFAAWLVGLARRASQEDT